MTKYRVVWRWSALCKGLHCIVIRTPYPIRIRERLKKELCQQFAVLHIRLSYQLRFSQKVISKVQEGEGSPCLQPGPIELAPSSVTLSTGTPRNAPAMEMALRLEGRR